MKELNELHYSTSRLQLQLHKHKNMNINASVERSNQRGQATQDLPRGSVACRQSTPVEVSPIRPPLYEPRDHTSSTLNVGH